MFSHEISADNIDSPRNDQLTSIHVPPKEIQCPCGIGGELVDAVHTAKGSLIESWQVQRDFVKDIFPPLTYGYIALA